MTHRCRHPERLLRRSVRVLAPLAVCALVVAPCRADELSVAVAANFRAPMQIIAPEFERVTGHKLVVAFGSTGKFYAQIKSGAPFEVLLAADDRIPIRLEQEGVAVAGSRFTYAVGKLALWSAKPDVVDDGAALLRANRFDHLALADPKLAPYGAAAVQTLQSLRLYEALRPKFVQGEDVSQAYQFVASGNAEIGFVALSQVYRGGAISGGSAWIVPADLYAPIRQDAVILDPGRGKPAAAALMRFLQADWARASIQSFGYGL